MFKGIYLNFSAKVFAFSVNSIFPLLVIPYVISVIGVDKFGSVEYGLSLLAFFQVIGMLGVPIVGMRAISKEPVPEVQISIVYNIMKYVWITNTIVIFSYVIFIQYFGQNLNLSSEISLPLGFIILANYVNVDWYFEGRKKFKFIAIKSIIVRLSQVVLIYLFVSNKEDSSLYALLFALGIFCGYFFGAVIFLVKNFKATSNITKTSIYLTPLILVFALQNSNLLFTQIDKLFLARTLTGDTNVAIYAIPQKISIYLNAVVYSLSFVAIPGFAKLLLNNIDSYWKSIKKLSQILLNLSIFFGIIVLMFNEEILNYLNLSNIVSAKLVLLIFMLRLPFIAIEGFFNTQIFLLNDKEKILVKYYFIFGVLNVITNIILFKELSPVSALLSTFLIEIILLFFLTKYIRNEIYSSFITLIRPSLLLILFGLLTEIIIYAYEPKMNMYFKIFFILIVFYFFCYHHIKNLKFNES
jgi:O-antigen/teichoic acid export membrane protein